VVWPSVRRVSQLHRPIQVHPTSGGTIRRRSHGGPLAIPRTRGAHHSRCTSPHGRTRQAAYRGAPCLARRVSTGPAPGLTTRAGCGIGSVQICMAHLCSKRALLAPPSAPQDEHTPPARGDASSQSGCIHTVDRDHHADCLKDRPKHAASGPIRLLGRSRWRWEPRPWQMQSKRPSSSCCQAEATPDESPAFRQGPLIISSSIPLKGKECLRQ
jgi:hypothetical protein